MNNSSANRIKCGGCNKLLMHLRFSETGLRKYRESLRQHQRKPKMPVRYPLCIECSPESRYEMTCIMCNTTKGLEQFSKQQRKKPDEAYCLDCMQEKEDREPVHQDEVTEVEIMDELKNGSKLSSNSSYLASRYGSHRSSTQQPDCGIDTYTNPGSNYSDASTSSYLIAGDISDTGGGGFANQGAVRKSLWLKAEEAIEREKQRVTESVAQAPYMNNSEDEDDDPPY